MDRPTLFPVAWQPPPAVEPKPLPPAPPSDHVRTVRVVHVRRSL
jgi:hypothetical protein